MRAALYALTILSLLAFVACGVKGPPLPPESSPQTDDKDKAKSDEAKANRKNAPRTAPK